LRGGVLEARAPEIETDQLGGVARYRKEDADRQVQRSRRCKLEHVGRSQLHDDGSGVLLERQHLLEGWSVLESHERRVGHRARVARAIDERHAKEIELSGVELVACDQVGAAEVDEKVSNSRALKQDSRGAIGGLALEDAIHVDALLVVDHMPEDER